MIAMPVPEPAGDSEPALVATRIGTRAGRGAVARRRATATRLRHRAVARIFAALAVVTVAIVVYLALLANVTRLQYAIGHANADRATLMADTALLDDRIARLESRERLARDAATLHMVQSQRFVQVALPEDPAPKRTGFALLGWLH